MPKTHRRAQQAWADFWEIGCSLAKLNRDRLRKQWQQEKQSRTPAAVRRTPVIEARRQQLHFGEGLIAEEVSDLREEWMKHADQVLEDEQLVATVYEALAKRSPKSRTRGRRGTPAEVVMRLLLLKHIRNWSYEVLEREVRANLVYRDFTRVGAAKAPDCKTMGRWGSGAGAGDG